jgi:glycolate oxidase
MSIIVSQFLPERLRRIVGPAGVLAAPGDLMVYECDGYTIEKNRPDVVVFPTTTEQVVQIVNLCNELDIPFLPRGAGTSLSGGCLPVGGGVMIALTRMKKILEINARDRYAVVEPGVVNLWLTNQLRPLGFHSGPVEPGRLHHRRQRRHQLRRSAHAQVRRHGQSRAGRGDRATGWFRCADRRRR